MDSNRKVYYIVFEGKDKSASKVIDGIGDTYKRLQKEINKDAGTTQDKSALYKAASYKSALKDIDRMRKENLRWEKTVAAEISKTDKLLADNKIREAKRSANTVIAELNQIRTQSKKIASDTQSAFSSAFKGGFAGGVVGSLVGNIIGVLSQIPAKAKQYLDEAVKIAEERKNALIGLQSTALFKGFDTTEAESIVKSLRLVKGGIVELSEAASAEKNLIQFGFNLEQSRNLLERFSDSAAFGKQSALTYGQAVSRTAEGIKNFSSGLSDAGGITKNLSVIMKEAGITQDDLTNKKTQAAAIEKYYQALLKETAGQVGNADLLLQGFTGTTSALTQAQKNLQVTVGEIITQNPEVLALLQHWTSGVNDVTAALQTQDSQQRVTFTSFVSGLAGGGIAIENLVDKASTNLKLMQNNLTANLQRYGDNIGNTLSLFGAAGKAIISTAIAGINILVDQTFNGFQRKVNYLIDGINSATGVNIPKLPEFELIADNTLNKINEAATAWQNVRLLEQNYYKDQAKNQQAALDNNKRNLKIVQDYENRVLNRNFQFDLSVDRNRKAQERLRNLQSPINGQTDDSDTSTSGGSKSKSRKKPDFKLSPQGQALVNAAERLGVSPLDLAAIIGFETGGTYNPNKVGGEGNKFRGLIQFGQQEQKQFGVTKGQSFEDQLNNSVVKFFQDRFAKVSRTTQGATLLDLYTTVIAGNPNANIDSKDSFGTSARTGTQRIAKEFRPQALKKFFGGSLSNIEKDYDIEKDLAERSDEITEKIRREAATEALRLLRVAGALPDSDVIQDIIKFQIQDAKSKGGAQPDADAIRREIESRARSTGTGGGIEIEEQKTLLEITREKFNLDEREGEMHRRRLGIMREITATVESESLARKEATLQAEIDYKVLLQRNIGEESALGFLQSQVERLREVGDIERDLSILRKQNSDNQFVEQRRLLVAKREQYDLEKQITELQDALAISGTNEALQIQIAGLQDILDLRQRETDAIIASQRAQLELAHSMDISNNQIRARVLDHLAGQKTLNESISDSIIDAYETAGSAIDKFFGKIPIVGGIAATATRNILSNITSNLLDTFLPGVGLGDALKKTSGNPVVDTISQGNSLLKKIEANTRALNISNPGSVFNRINPNHIASNNPLSALTSIFGGGHASNGLPNILGSIFGGSGHQGSLGTFLGSHVGGAAAPGSLTGIGTASAGGSGFLSSIFSAGGIGGALTTGGVSLGVQALIASLQTHSPAKGALLGGLVGFVAGIFNRNKRRRAEERLRTQYINDAFGGLKAFDDLIADVRALRIQPPESAITQGQNIADQIRQNYLTQAGALKDKKTRNIALKDVSRIDDIIKTKMEELRRMVDVAKAAGERQRRILPEFADGGLVSQFFKNNFSGLVPGIYDRKDDKLIKVSGREVVLTPDQWQPITPYLRQKRVKGFADGGLVGSSSFSPNVSVSPNINLTVNMYEREDGGFDVYLDSGDGERKIKAVVNKLKANKEI